MHISTSNQLDEVAAEKNLLSRSPEKKVESVHFSTSPVVVQNIQNIQVNTLGHHQQVVVSPIGQIGGPTVVAGSANTAVVNATPGVPLSDPFRFPGWPDKWPAPSVLPAPFKPLGFEISQPELEAAVGSLTEEERLSCARGDTLGVARLLVEILKRVHSDPKERNVYLNPSRSDSPSESAGSLTTATVIELRSTATAEGDDPTSSGVCRGCAGKLPRLASSCRPIWRMFRRATASGEGLVRNRQGAIRPSCHYYRMAHIATITRRGAIDLRFFSSLSAAQRG